MKEVTGMSLQELSRVLEDNMDVTHLQVRQESEMVQNNNAMQGLITFSNLIYSELWWVGKIKSMKISDYIKS